MRLPPLSAIRAFDAAARYGGFKSAAAELSVTPGAVSHQVRELETWLGRALFERRPAGVVLTDAGRRFHAHVDGTFDRLADAVRALSEPDPAPVRIRADVSLAAKWLAPRVPALMRAVPGVPIRVASGPFEPDLERRGIDLALYYSRGPRDGVHQEPLLRGWVRAMAAPGVAARLGIRPGDDAPPPERLLDTPLLRTVTEGRGWREPDWPDWCSAVGLPWHGSGAGAGGAPFAAGFLYEHLTQEACLAGGGVALLTDLFTEGAVAAGALVAVSDVALPTPTPYALWTPEAAARRPEVAAVRQALRRAADPTATMRTGPASAS